jgi:hypothetical protein
MNEILTYSNASRYFVNSSSIDEFADAFVGNKNTDEAQNDDSYDAFFKATGKSFHEYLRQFDDMI